MRDDPSLSCRPPRSRLGLPNSTCLPPLEFHWPPRHPLLTAECGVQNVVDPENRRHLRHRLTGLGLTGWRVNIRNPPVSMQILIWKYATGWRVNYRTLLQPQSEPPGSANTADIAGQSPRDSRKLEFPEATAMHLDPPWALERGADDCIFSKIRIYDLFSTTASTRAGLRTPHFLDASPHARSRLDTNSGTAIPRRHSRPRCSSRPRDNRPCTVLIGQLSLRAAVPRRSVETRVIGVRKGPVWKSES